MNVSLAFAGPMQQAEVTLTLAEDATIADALKAAVGQADVKVAIAVAVAFGIWGKLRPTSHRLREGDRVEIYCALQADPKVARRRKANDNKVS